MKTYEVNGTYGSGNTPCKVFVVEQRNGMSYYVAEGGTIVNLTPEVINEGVNIEGLYDVDCFTYSPIYSLDDLVEAIEG